MLLEFKVWGSDEWYGKAVPMLEDAGFVALDNLQWADPETDGELMGIYYDFTDKGSVAALQIAEVLARIKKVIEEGEAPPLEINFVATPVPKA
jgi:hypothetical protein